jgi:phthiocerol/phenolphthiocerol synthesis type-I polyketide synthase E
MKDSAEKNQAPPGPDDASRPWQLLTWSANTPTELDTMSKDLADFLNENKQVNLADAAYTLKVGRDRLPHRRMLVCRDREDALRVLENDPSRILTAVEERRERKVAFLLPGQGAQYVNMGKELYDHEPLFRADVDYCCEYSKPYLKIDLRDLLYPKDDKVAEAAELLAQTRLTQTAVFTIEYAVARQWMRWGVEPMGMIGHSLGEFAAACIAGVFSVEEGLRLVATRGRLMQQVAGGAMLSVMLSEEELNPLLDQIGGLEIAVINTPSSCVVSGSRHKIETLEAELTRGEVMSRRLRVTGAGHSSAVEPILDDFRRVVLEVRLQLPTMPYLSNLTGKWISGKEITDPDYWVSHLRHTVRFADGAAELLKDPELVLLEVGPGTTLSKLLSQHAARPPRLSVLSSLPPANEPQPDMQYMLGGLGMLWMEGAKLEWSRFYETEKRSRLELPTHPFDEHGHIEWPQAEGNTAAT